MLQKFWFDYEEWKKGSDGIGVKVEFTVCLARSESDLWQQLKSTHNYFNVGNNDRGDTRKFISDGDAIMNLWAIALNNRYLWTKTTIWHLSPNHMDSSCQKEWRDDKKCKYVYASSKENWLNNMRNCPGNIYQEQVMEDFNFRK